MVALRQYRPRPDGSGLDRAGRVEREPHADLGRAHGVTAGIGAASARCTVARETPMMPAICSTVARTWVSDMWCGGREPLRFGHGPGTPLAKGMSAR